MSTRAPPFTRPSTFSSGTAQSRKTSSQVFEPRMPSLSSFCAVVNPSQPFSTMNAVMPRDAAVGSVCAQTHADDVRPGLGFRHGQRAHVFAADQIRKILALLRLRAVLGQLIDAQV